MKLQNFTIIFIIIILPIILLTSLYISTGLKTLKYQALYDTGLITATQDAIQAYEINMANNKFSENPETKRNIVKSSIKMFESSLSNNCNISSYSAKEIEEYIPAIVYGLSDGFYTYAPSLDPKTGKYEHSLKNYVYYSESLTGKDSDDEGIVIRYNLDSYVNLSGTFDGTYESKEGYLINTDKTVIKKTTGAALTSDTDIDQFYNKYREEKDNDRSVAEFIITYYGVAIDMEDKLAVTYFVDNYKFSRWFQEKLSQNIVDNYPYLKISETNDPEDPNSEFVQHKNGVIKSKLETVLNSTITAYSTKKWGQNYRMPKLSAADFEKIYTDVSMITFFQGKKIGLTEYNGYCVLNSNNHSELINPNLLYFSTDDGGPTNKTTADNAIDSIHDNYHDIRCSTINGIGSIKEADTKIETIRGWKIGRFQRNKISTGDYQYERKECACYECINGSISNKNTIYEYIYVNNSTWGTEHANTLVTRSYWTSLARERAKLHEDRTIDSDVEINKYVDALGTKEKDIFNNSEVDFIIQIKNKAEKTDYINIQDNVKDAADQITYKSIKSIKAYVLDPADSSIIKSTKNYETDMATITGGKLELNIQINENEIIEIIYTARVSDLNVNGEVDNIAVVSLAGGGVLDSDTAKCKILRSVLAIDKSAAVTSSEYAGYVDYVIKVTNNAVMTDRIVVDDKFNEIKMNISGGVTFYKNGSAIAALPNATITDPDVDKSWGPIDLNPGDTLEIRYKARLKGDIGEALVNDAIVKSEFTGSTVQDNTTCQTEKTVTIGGKSGNYNVILLLDASLSMVGNFEKVGATAEDLEANINNIKPDGTNKVQVLAFAQQWLKLSNASAYSALHMSHLGISTNYLGALTKAKNYIDSSKNNYIVFMTDGAPTNTQDATFTIPFLDDESKVFQVIGDSILQGLSEAAKNLIFAPANIITFVVKFVINTVASVIGGWVECLWTNETTYKYRLLLSGDIAFGTEVWKGITDALGATWANVPEAVWIRIMAVVDELKNMDGVREIFTVYFNSSLIEDTAPVFGLQKMSTGKSFYSKNIDELKEDFARIAEMIANLEKEIIQTSASGYITIQYFDRINAINVGGEEISSTDLALVKSKIVDQGGGIGKLYIGDPALAGIFKTDKSIKIVLK